MRIVQIAPEIGPGSGVAGVAHALELKWLSQGNDVSRFTMSDAHGDWIPEGSGAVSRHLSHLLRVVWFSSVGTVVARRHLAASPGAVAVCHNDALVGDVYINHGILEEAMRARGHFLFRMVRNPLHTMTWLRDRWRFSAYGPHRLVVNLSNQDDAALRRLHPRLNAETTVIGNGVDVDRFRPSSLAQRSVARSDLGLDPADAVVLFVGHEFDRKGLGPLLEAIAASPAHVRLLVVGGDFEMVRRAETRAADLGVADRVRFVGRVPDPRPYLAAGDLFALPSAYEAHSLAVLEALASGLAVVVTPTGGATDVVVDGENGWVVEATGPSIARAIGAYLASEPEAMRRAARASAERLTWSSVANRYLDKFVGLASVPQARR